jgi:hypothetical protein
MKPSTVLALAAAVAVLGPASAQAPAGMACVAYDATPIHTLELRGLCNGWKLWKDGNVVTFVCPGMKVPQGAVELREYYVFGR